MHSIARRLPHPDHRTLDAAAPKVRCPFRGSAIEGRWAMGGAGVVRALWIDAHTLHTPMF